MSDPDPTEAPGTNVPQVKVRRRRSVQESLGSIVLGFEVIVVFLGALVIFGLKALPAPVALGGGGALVVVMLATIALLRYRWGIWIGWALQLIVLASGFLVGMMFVVGALFTALWTYCMITGARLDRRTPETPEPTQETENPL